MSRVRRVFLILSGISAAACATGAALHYLKRAPGNAAHPAGWLLSMLFLLSAFLPGPRGMAAGLRSLIKPKTGFFVFWVLFFVVSHLWNFRTSPWNGDGLFDDSAVDLLYLKNYVMGRPFQAAWFHPQPFLISRETLFHYYVWGFLHFFGYNILSYELALLVLWCGAFLFTLLLAELFFESYIVTSVTALILNFLPFAFIYTFVGYRYPLTVLLCVASLYFLHVGFRKASGLALSLGGIAAGLCLASSISGKQYLLALLAYGLIYAVLYWKSVSERSTWWLVGIVLLGFFAAAMPILCYVAFNHADYTFYEGVFLHDFWGALHGHRSPHDLNYYFSQLPKLFFDIPGPRLFLLETLPIPLPYYLFLVPGFVLAFLHKRYEVVLLATIPVLGVFVSAGITVEHRLLLAIPFWILLMGFAFAALLRLRLPAGLKTILLVAAAGMLATAFVPSVQHIYSKTKSPSAIHYFAQDQVAVSRFLKHIVAGQEHPDPPRLERDELNRIKDLPDPSYDTFICPAGAWSIIHLFLHDYGDEKVLSFCRGGTLAMMTEQQVWSANKKAIVDYTPRGRDLKLIWQNDPKMERIRGLLASFRDLATEDSTSFSVAGRTASFYVLNIPRDKLPQFQQRISALSDTSVIPAPDVSGDWTPCANEAERCNFSGTKQVRYGADGIYTYSTFHDGVVCSNTAFGSDPLFGVIKHCEYADLSTPAPTSRPNQPPR